MTTDAAVGVARGCHCGRGGGGRGRRILFAVHVVVEFYVVHIPRARILQVACTVYSLGFSCEALCIDSQVA